MQDLHGVDELDGQKVLKGSNVLSYFYVDASVEAAELKYSIGRLLMGLAALLAVLLGRLVPFTEVQISLVDRGNLNQGHARSSESDYSDSAEIVIVGMQAEACSEDTSPQEPVPNDSP